MPQRYWLHQIRYFSLKIARYKSHIEFLGSCLRVGLIPRGLTLRFPISAAPPAMRSSITSFSRACSFEYTKLVLHQYQSLHWKLLHENLIPLLNVVSLIGGDLAYNAHVLVQNANDMLNIFRSNHLRKLSALYVQHLRSGRSLQLRNPPHRFPLYTDFVAPSQQTPVNHSMGVPVVAEQTVHPESLHTGEVSQGNSESVNPPSSSTNVCNLSSRPLSDAEISVLSKGLTFTPTPRPDHIKLQEDIEEFCWRLRLKFYWHNNPDSDENATDILHPSLHKFKPPSNFDPKLNSQTRLPPSHPLEQYISQLIQRTSTASFLNSLTPRDNLSAPERHALRTLKSDMSVKIMPADKGSTVVIMNSSDYEQEGMRQLSDTRFYEMVSSDPTQELAADLRRYIRSHGISEGLSSSDIEHLVPNNPQCPDFYLLPKIHKPYSLPDRPPPCRPIVASFGCVTERVSAFVDSHLQPIVQIQPSFIKDTEHFLSILRDINVPADVILATIDVNSLYTEIPHEEGLHALTLFLQERSVHQTPSTDFLVKLAECVLTMNCFKFGDRTYLQKRGTAMGTRMAPSYANLFMAGLENGFLASRDRTPLLWKRFIDDIFLIWPHGEDELLLFLNDLNSHFSVSFTWSYSRTSATFLDVDITLRDNQFMTAVHVKPTNKQQYLHYDSCHPPHTKRSIPRSLSIRGHRICSSQDNLESYLSGIQDKLVERGYPRRFVRNRMVPANVNYQSSPRTSSDRVSLVTTFFFGAQKINSILRELQTTLVSNPLTRDVFRETPRVAYRQGKKIGEILSHRHPQSHSQGPGQLGIHPCGRPRCRLCNLVIDGPEFSSANTSHTYRCRGTTECQSRMCVYQLLCRKCTDSQAFYVGKATTPLNLRMNNHRASVVQSRQLPIATHALSHQATFDECFGVKVLCTMPEANDRLLQQSERAHIRILGANRPPGLNLND